MNKNKYILLVVVVLISSMSMACVTEDYSAPDKNSSAIAATPGVSSKESQTEPAVEIVLFHGTRRCTSCIVTGQLLDEVLQSIHAARRF